MISTSYILLRNRYSSIQLLIGHAVPVILSYSVYRKSEVYVEQVITTTTFFYKFTLKYLYWIACSQLFKKIGIHNYIH